jgi:hypothetical protein
MRGAAAAALGLGLWLLLGGEGGAGDKGGKVGLAQADFARLVAHEARSIQDALSKGTLDKKSVRKVRAAAFMVAVYAQASMGTPGTDSKALATLRDHALKLSRTVEDGNFKEAAALAMALTPTPKADAGAKTDLVPLDKQLEFENVMRMFSSERVGGYGLEKFLEEMTEHKDAFTAEHHEKLTVLGFKMAMIAHAANAYADEKNEGGKKTKQNWLTLSEQFRVASLGLGEAAKSKSAPAIRSALEKVNGTCIKCHDIFR